MERYFVAMHLDNDEFKINTATMYLANDDILWWRQHEDLEKKMCVIGTWEEFKADSKEHDPKGSRILSEWLLK